MTGKLGSEDGRIVFTNWEKLLGGTVSPNSVAFYGTPTADKLYFILSVKCLNV